MTRSLTGIAGLLLALAIVAPGTGWAAGGPLGIDHEWNRDAHGIWADSNQKTLEVSTVAVELAGALALGSSDRLGHAFWQTIDSTAVSSVSVLVLKRAFSRARPNQGLGPDRWFRGSCCSSFPSGEVTLQASFVTPLILAYRTDHPLVWALEALPLYDAIGRLKNQAHWQTDVLAAWALGTATGVWAGHRREPLSVEVLPRGLTVGFVHRY